MRISLGTIVKVCIVIAMVMGIRALDAKGIFDDPAKLLPTVSVGSNE